MTLITLTLAVILLIVLVFWFGGLWLARGEDLTVHDHPVDPDAGGTVDSQAGASPEHGQAEAEIRAAGVKVKGMSRKQMLLFTRQFMEDMSRGKSFNCEFVPVDAGGVPAEWVLAPGVDPTRRVLYIHGGAFIAGNPGTHRSITSRFSEAANAAVLAIDYRLMPEHPRRKGIEDCKTAYRWLIEPPARIFMGGDSAGGNLSLVLSGWIRDEKLRRPDAIVALSPLTDSTYSGPSIRDNLPTDTMLGPLFGALTKIPKPILSWIFFLENRIRQSDPLVSPVFAELSNLPPTLLQVSEAEMLFDDARRYVNKARAAGSPAFLQSWPGLLHVWQIFYPEVPEAREAWEQVDTFLKRVETETS